MSEISDHIVELQSKVLFQEDVIQKLDDVIVKQSKLLDQLILRVQELHDKVEQLSYAGDNPGSAIDEKPPHY
jgi:SlyX protein